jgi:hypothetical protein
MLVMSNEKLFFFVYKIIKLDAAIVPTCQQARLNSTAHPSASSTLLRASRSVNVKNNSVVYSVKLGNQEYISFIKRPVVRKTEAI